MIGRLSATTAVVTLATVWGAPVAPVAAAPSCPAALRYAAEAGAEVARIAALDARPLGGNQQARDVRLAGSRAGLVAQAPVNAAAVARLLGASAEQGVPADLASTVGQQAPPDNQRPGGGRTAARDVGPVTVGAGTSAVHARWDAGMACGAAAGEAGSARSGFASLALLPGDGDAGLLRAPTPWGARSATLVEHRGGVAHAVARAEATLETFTLLDGQVTVSVTRQPALQASIAGSPGSTAVRYTPPAVEVRGAGFPPRRLDEAGDDVELALAATAPAAPEAAPAGPLAALGAAAPLALPGLPARPGVPTLPDRARESTQAGDGARLRISLGEPRQQAVGQAVAARAVAVRVELAVARQRADDRTAAAHDGPVLDLDLGVLEAAAVAPEPDAGPAPGGRAAGLPVTGVDVDAALAVGLLLLVGGVWCLVLGLRCRAVRP